MYTVCPKCALPLAVTAADLRAGQGYVRCGRCANVFNALLRLSEESGPPASSYGAASLIDPDLDRASATMSRPALQDPVLVEPSPPEPAPPPPPAPAKSIYVEPEPYDPEVTNPKIGIAPLPLTPPPAAPTPPRPASAPALRLVESPPRPPPADPELDEPREPQREAQAAEPGERPEEEDYGMLDDEDDLDDEHDEPPGNEQAEPQALERAGPQDAEQAAASPEESGDWDVADFQGTGTFETIVLEGDTYLQTAESIPEEVLASEIANVSRRIAEANNTAEFEALMERVREADGEPDEDEPRDGKLAPELAALREATGEFKHLANGALEDDDPTQWFEAIHLWADWRVMAAAGVLALILIVQMLNHWRNDLATRSGWFGMMSGLSAMLGEPLRPNWDLSAYDLRQLGAASDSDDNQTLKVKLSLTNIGKHAQALPLIRLTLLDRYGKAVSRGELEPAQYLPKDEHGLSMIRRDQRIDTEVRVFDPSRQASSFELDVCVAAAGGGLRCAADTPVVAKAL